VPNVSQPAPPASSLPRGGSLVQVTLLYSYAAFFDSVHIYTSTCLLSADFCTSYGDLGRRPLTQVSVSRVVSGWLVSGVYR
jgi:hypothetical protein